MSFLAVHVNVKIEANKIPSFYQRAKSASQELLREQGVLRYDILRNNNDKNKFLLIKVFDDVNSMDIHKTTSQYQSWLQESEAYLTEPRNTDRFKTLFPAIRAGWNSQSAVSIPSDDIAPANSQTGTADAPTDLDKSVQAGQFAVVVNIKVIPAFINEFITATVKNCRASLLEAGVTRFDFLQHQKDPSFFNLTEIYNSPDAPGKHKATAHYAEWAATVQNMMAAPRSSVKYTTLFPAPLYYHQSAATIHPDDKGLSGAPASFTFLAPKILMGRGIAAASIGQALKDLCITKPFIVTGASGFSRQAEVLASVFQLPVATFFNHQDAIPLPHYCIRGEPSTNDAQQAAALARAHHCDGVLAIGGGSALDLGKAVAALATNTRDVYEYLEVVGKGQPIENVPLPMIAVPTTAGTGSEVTKNAVLKSLEHGVKASIRHDTMLPRVAIIDPVLSQSCSPEVTAHVGLDTLCQVIEPYVSNAANPFTDALAKEGVLRASRSLRVVVAEGHNLEAREDLAVACVCGGLALANAKLGAVHGFAAVLGGMFEYAPHGAICAALLPPVFQANVKKLNAMQAAGHVDAAKKLSRFVEVSRIVTGNPAATAEEGAAWLSALVRDLQVPGVRALCGGQISEEQIKDIVALTAVASSTKGNPIPLDLTELEDILRSAM